MSMRTEPDTARPGKQARRIAGREIVFDEEGFFNDYYDWSEEAFKVLAAESGMTLISVQHWKVIRFLREFYAHNGRSPLNHQLREGTGLGALEMQRLFPEGIKLGARRLAGLPNPKTCS